MGPLIPKESTRGIGGERFANNVHEIFSLLTSTENKR